MRDEVALGDPPDLALFGRGHRFLGTAVGFVGPGLDLDEDEGRAVAGDDVDLAAEQAKAPGDDLVALLAEIAAGDLLAGAAQVLGRSSWRPSRVISMRARGRSGLGRPDLFPADGPVLGVLEDDADLEKLFADLVGAGRSPFRPCLDAERSIFSLISLPGQCSWWSVKGPRSQWPSP